MTLFIWHFPFIINFSVAVPYVISKFLRISTKQFISLVSHIINTFVMLWCIKHTVVHTNVVPNKFLALIMAHGASRIM